MERKILLKCANREKNGNSKNNMLAEKKNKKKWEKGSDSK